MPNQWPRDVANGIISLVVVPMALNVFGFPPLYWIIGGLVSAAVLYIISHSHRLGWRRRLGPVTLMLFGAAILVGGAVWFRLQPGPGIEVASAGPQASLKTEKQPRPVLTGEPKQRAEHAFLAMQDFLNNEAEPLISEGRALSSWRKSVEKDGLDESVSKLLAFRERKDKVSLELARLQREHSPQLALFGISADALRERIDALHAPIQELYGPLTRMDAAAAKAAISADVLKGQSDQLGRSVSGVESGVIELRPQIEGAMLHLATEEAKP